MRNQDHENHPLENLMRLVLITFGLVVIIAMVVVCMPSGSSFGHGWKQAFTSMTSGWRNTVTQFTQNKIGSLIGQGSSKAALDSSRMVSYNDPRVRSTMDIPWARN